MSDWTAFDLGDWQSGDPRWFAVCPHCSAVVDTGGSNFGDEGDGRVKHLRSVHDRLDAPRLANLEALKRESQAWSEPR